MKKLLGIFFSLVLTFSLTVQAFAADVDITETSQGASFEISDVVDYAQAYGIRNEDAIVRIPVQLSVNDDVSTELVVEMVPAVTRASGTLNFTVSGNFHRTSDNVTVSVYGLSASFEYTGNDTKITGKDSYHNSTADKWSGTHRTSTSKDDSEYNISVLKGDYTLYYNKKENNTAWIKIAVSKSGIYSVGGDYVSYNVN